MTLSLRNPEVRRSLDRLAPFARTVLEEAARFADRLHADEVTVEHVLASMLRDERSGAARALLLAFADPRSLATEVTALCPGILVVGSECCIPFSVLGVRALFASRSSATALGEGRVEPARILTCAVRLVAPKTLEALATAGFRGPEQGPHPAAGSVDSTEGGLFSSFSSDAKRSLGAAGHIAHGMERAAVGPTHLVLGCLEVSEDLRRASGVTATRARLAVAGRDGDDTPLEPRELEADEDLVELLGRLGEGADTVDILAGLLAHGAVELRQLLVRQRITAAMVERSRGAVGDPDPDP